IFAISRYYEFLIHMRAISCFASHQANPSHVVYGDGGVDGKHS
ncbi:hypothetical protein A2U01_0073568, partial [Trifolium medium]|nr:hypothetical protein [Trifolium medium]